MKSIKSNMLNQQWQVIFKVEKNSSTFFQSELSHVLQFRYLMLGFLMMVSIICIVFLELKPVESIVKVLGQADHGDYSHRVKLNGNSELISIGDAVNALLDRVEMDRTEGNRRFMNTITALVNTIDAKDHYTGGHSSRVSIYAKAIGDEMGLSHIEMANLHVGSALHDIGKIGIPDSIIQKPGKLSEEEYIKIKSHCQTGYDLLKDLDIISGSLEIIKNHHERYDGTGYPNGLYGNEIDLGSRIVSLADAFDAMTSFRTYRITFNQEEAAKEISRCSGTHFDPVVVEAFVNCIRKGTINLHEQMSSIMECSN